MKGKYETNVLPRLEEIKAWARDGVRELDMAKNCGVAHFTWIEYKKRHPELAEAVAKNKQYIDDVIVVNAYLKRVLGYEIDEPTREYVYKYNEDGTSEKILVKERVTRKHIPGDPRAGEFWLTRRASDKWPMLLQAKIQERQDGEQEGGVVLIPEVKEDEQQVSTDGNSVGTTA